MGVWQAASSRRVASESKASTRLFEMASGYGLSPFLPCCLTAPTVLGSGPLRMAGRQHLPVPVAVSRKMTFAYKISKKNRFFPKTKLRKKKPSPPTIANITSTTSFGPFPLIHSASSPSQFFPSPKLNLASTNTSHPLSRPSRCGSLGHSRDSLSLT